MKKISILILVFVLFIINLFNPLYKLNASVNLIEAIEVDITGSSTSDITLKFEVDEELLDLEITIRYTIDGVKTSEFIYSSGHAISDKCEVKELGTPLVNGKYRYCFVLTSAAKISTFRLDFTYKTLTSPTITETLYVTNGNPNISEAKFSPMNAIIIGFVATLFASIGTYIMIKSSEQNVQISEEE